MISFLLRYGWPILLINLLPSTRLFAQKLVVDAYDARILTKEGGHLRGLLTDVDSSYVYVGYGGQIPLQLIRKVTLHRKNKIYALSTGAILGGLLTGYLAHQSLQTSQTRSPLAHGITVTFAVVGGAAGGLLAGSGVHSLSRKVVRPPRTSDANRYLLRQLTPFSTGYQRRILNRVPYSSP